MNPWSQFHSMDFDVLGSFLTVLFVVCFVGWSAWAFAPWKRADHEAAARLPLDGGDR